MGLTEKIFEGILTFRGIEEVANSRTPGAGCFEAEVVGEFDGHVRKQRVKEENDY